MVRSEALSSQTHLHSWHLKGPKQSQVTFSNGSYKALIYIRKLFFAEERYSILTETFSHKRFLVNTLSFSNVRGIKAK